MWGSSSPRDRSHPYPISQTLLPLFLLPHKELSSPIHRKYLCCGIFPPSPASTLLCHQCGQHPAGEGQERPGLSQDSCRQSSHQGFHSGGNGATMPSLASHISSGSFSGSIPISRAKSWISRKTEEESMEMVYTRHYAIKPASSAKAMGTLGNPDPETKLLKAVSTALCVSEHVLPGW